ncbi:MAG: hypothetical protein ACJAZO_000963 [Myxococcota bacterium]|jgi:uncharacterized protein (DUF1499 family)
MFRLFSLPRINDISTDLQDPPAFVSDSGRPCAGVSYPSNFKSKVAESYSDLSSEPLAMSAGDAFARAVRIAGEMDAWEVVHTDSDTLQLEAVCTTSLLRFKDDVCIRVTADGDGARVDMRSRSRLGKHDFGANADRIRAYFSRLR